MFNLVKYQPDRFLESFKLLVDMYLNETIHNIIKMDHLVYIKFNFANRYRLIVQVKEHLKSLLVKQYYHLHLKMHGVFVLKNINNNMII